MLMFSSKTRGPNFQSFIFFLSFHYVLLSDHSEWVTQEHSRQWDLLSNAEKEKGRQNEWGRRCEPNISRDTYLPMWKEKRKIIDTNMTKVKYIKENDAPRLHGYILASTRRLCRYNHASTRRLCRYNLVTTLTRHHMHNHVTTTTMHVAKASDSKQMNKHKHVKALLRIKEKRPLIR